VRITVQLIDAEHGFHLWSNEYDRDLGDVFATQDEIASAVTEALVPRLKAEDTPVARGGTQNVTAYDEYLKGREKWRTRDLGRLREAIGHFRTAVRLDPDFALAWSGLADAIDALAWRDIGALDLLPEGRLAAFRAVALDPEMAEGWVSAGILAAEFDLDFEVGVLALRRAIELRPSYANANQQLGSLLNYMGRVEEARRYFEKAVEVDPLSWFFHINYADNLFIGGETEHARREYLRADELGRTGQGSLSMLLYARRLGLSPGEAADFGEAMARQMGLEAPAAWRVVGEAIATGSRTEEAIAVIDGSTGLTRIDEFGLRLQLGQREETIAYLEEMRRAGAGELLRISVYPEFDPLRDDPRFIEIVESLGLPNGYDPDAPPAGVAE
jgi:serine/threonine-protein kinase